jgi:hypothetical protein
LRQHEDRDAPVVLGADRVGMRMSTTATSGRVARTIASRSSAVPHWPTTSKPASVRSLTRPSRRSTESSARTTRSAAVICPPRRLAASP